MNRFWRSLAKGILTSLGFVLLLSSSGCRSFWVDASVENQTGATIRELEIDYPTASFGTNSLGPGAVMHYRFQIRGSGPVKVEYTDQNGKPVQAKDLTLIEKQHGQLTLRLLPQGKVQFIPNLQPAS